MAWSWKLATSTDDVVNFLNGAGAYRYPASEARICAMWMGNNPEYYVFYRPQRRQKTSAIWGWKLATDPDDVMRFLNGSGSYSKPVKDAQITAVWKGSHREFLVFYRLPAPREKIYANWGWKLATNPSDCINFLNGTQGYRHPVTAARIVSLEKDGAEEFYVFYQMASRGDPISNWGWKLATTVDDARNFINGQGAYQHEVKGFQPSALWKGSQALFYIFANQGTRIWLQSPLENERFVRGEPFRIRALVSSDAALDGSALTWSSSLDGELGRGNDFIVNHLSPGSHSIRVSGYGVTAEAPLRVFADLAQFYQASPAPAEIERINKEFSFKWISGSGTDEQWGAYTAAFDQESTDPSKIVIYAKLDVLRHQAFSEPLPFAGGKSVYDHFRTFVRTINLSLDCSGNYGGGGHIYLDRPLSVWDGRSGDDCKRPFPNPEPYPYINPLYLLIHEERHNEPDDPGHIYSGGSQMDPRFDGGSGHAWAALYTMWVYKYGKYDPPAIKNTAKAIAISIMSGRFPGRPTHPDPGVQAIIDELLSP